MGFLAVFKGKENINCFHKESQMHQITGVERELRSPSPQPLPLPSTLSSVVSSNKGSYRSSSTDSPLTSSPLPLPPLARGLHNFSLEEILVACQHFSFDRCISQGVSCVTYRASFSDDPMASKKLEATITCLRFSSQGQREFLSQVSKIGSLKHPQLCEVLGFHSREGSDQRMIVYEGLFYGSLDRILYGRSNVPSLGWNARMKIALSTAEGLAFLHENEPFQAMYSEFSSANIQVNKDFSAKLSGYGCVVHNPETEFSNTQLAVANLSVEVQERDLITPKSNLWSFGVILVELLTGRKDSDTFCTKERDIVQWSKPFLADESRLSLIMDPHLKGRFPPKAVQIVAKIALNCLHKDPSKRPLMRTVVEWIRNAHDIKYSCRCPLREPSTVREQQISRLSSVNNIAKTPGDSLLTPKPFL